jgi:FkbM family methyltransferase
VLTQILKRVATALTPIVVRRSVAIPTPLGFRFVLKPDDPKSLKMASGFYEREDVRVYKTLKLRPGLILDVGANIGFFSLLFAHIFPQCQVHAFEPNPYAFDRLQENLKANPKLSKRIATFDNAASDREQRVELTTVPGAAGHAWGRVGISRRDGMVTYDVAATTIDRLYAASPLPVRLIKIDVEGYELPVLEGASAVVAEFRPIIVFEVSLSFLIEQPGTYQRQLEFADKHGYKPMVFGGAGLVPYTWPYARVFNMWLIPDVVPPGRPNDCH